MTTMTMMSSRMREEKRKRLNKPLFFLFMINTVTDIIEQYINSNICTEQNRLANAGDDAVELEIYFTYSLLNLIWERPFIEPIDIIESELIVADRMATEQPGNHFAEVKAAVLNDISEYVKELL